MSAPLHDVCTFCNRPLTTQFAYRKPSAANVELCTRKDCRKARKRAACPETGPTVKTIPCRTLKQESRLTEGDAVTESKKNIVHRAVFVKADQDTSVPMLEKIRLTSSYEASVVLDRAHRATAQYPKQPRRVVFNPPVDHRSHRTRIHPSDAASEFCDELTKRLQEIERPYKGHPILPAPQENHPSREKLMIDNIRNEWFKEKLEEDNRVLLETLVPVQSSGVFSFRLSTGLSVQNLVAFIGDEKFKATTAISRREATFYKDYAKGEELTVELIVKRHGVWGDEEIVELENRIIRHAAAVGLIIRPPHMLPETDPLDGEELEHAVIKTHGNEIGGSIHQGRQSKDGSYSFRTPLPRSGRGSGLASSSGIAQDDYSEESAA
jgi:hypothetical protein